MLKPGDTIDIWVVDRALGQGGMGSVYRCHNREARRILAAVKVLDVRLGRQDVAKARFIREAEILFALDHRNIVKVRNVRMDVELPYLEMEFIDGVNLEARVREGPLPPATALPLFRQVADALTHLHAKGIRHRDIKPSNLVVQADGVVKLVDFGIATEADGATITQQGQTFGSASYAPPEWLDPTELDPVRWDIYATGVVFWEVFTGVQAFPITGPGSMHQQVFRLLTAKQHHPRLDPGPRVPRALRSLIGDMTEPDWRRRLATAAEVRARLEQIDLDDLDPSGEEPSRSWVPVEITTAERAPAGMTMVPSEMGEPFADRQPKREVSATLAGLGEPERGASRPEAWRPANPAPGSEDVSTPGMLGGREPREPGADRSSPGQAAARSPRESADRSSPGRVAGTPREPGADASGRAASTAKAASAAGSGAAFTGLVGAALGALGVFAVGGLAAGAWYLNRPTDRPVVITLSGAEPAPATATLGGRPPDTAAGRILTWNAVPLGTVPLRAVVGQDCTLEGGPAWCVTTDTSVEVARGEGPLSTSVPLPPPAVRDVRVRFQGLASPPSARLDGGPAVSGTAAELVIPGILPGPHEIVAWLGCAEADVGCAEAACPPGCASWTGRVELPAGEGVFDVEAALKAPVEPAKAAPTAPAAPRSRGAVTAGAFARWLGGHPEWLADAARAAGKADAGYLNGWDGANPPAGKGGGAMVNVSWAAANAYCAGRGGLVGVDEGALTWTESASQPWHEFRSAGGRPAWRRSDGATSVAVKPSESGAFIGFRCAR